MGNLRVGEMARARAVLAVIAVSSVALGTGLPDDSAGADSPVLLQETVGKNGKVFSHDTKGVLPPGTTTLREVNHVTNGKCRYTCHEEPLCSGYQWTGNDNKCTLLQAPSHLQNAAENAAWHKAAAEIVGAPYKKEKPLIDPAKLAAAEAAVLPRKKKAIKKLSLHQNIGKLITEAKQDASKAVAEATPEGKDVAQKNAAMDLAVLQNKIANLQLSLKTGQELKQSETEIKKKAAALEAAQSLYKKRRQIKLDAEKQLAKAKAEKLLGEFKVSQIKLYANMNLKRMESAVEPAVVAAAKEKAKAELRKKDNMDLMAKDKFKSLDKDIERLTGTYKNSVRAAVVDKLSTQFMLDLEKFVVDKTAAYKQKMIKSRISAIDKVVKKKQAGSSA